MTKTIVNRGSHGFEEEQVAPPLSEPGLRVTQISTSAVRGGAARAAYRLHSNLPGQDIFSQMLVAQRFGRNEDSLEYNPLAPVPAALGRIFFRVVRRWHRPSFRKAGAYLSLDRTPVGLRLVSQLPPSDLVNLHWVADLLDYRILPKLTARVPVVWTFHDMNAFTGGCHYSGSCERYTARCGACPQLKTSSGENDLTRRVMNRKLSVVEKIHPARFVIVCPSRWLAGEVGRSSLFKRFDAHVIPNGIDPEEYFPVAQAEARRRLNLPASAKIVLFVADNLADPRKGFRVLLEALRMASDIPDLLLLVLGRGDVSPLTGLSCRHLGELHDLESLRNAYSAADVFAISSLQDNLPNTILESMACGTPVAGFDVGGIGEVVVDGQTGLLAPGGNAAGLAHAFHRILGNRTLRQSLAEESRLRVEQEYTTKLQAARYAALYRRIVLINRSLNPKYP